MTWTALDRPGRCGFALLALLALLALPAACGGRPAAAPLPLRGKAASRPMVVRAPSRPLGPARWFPVGEAGGARYRDQDPDGRLRMVDRGLRFALYPDGRIQRAGDLLPSTGTLSVLELPERLGGGFVYRLASEGSTDLYRSPSWTSRLEPLARLPFEVAELTAGFDRLYASSSRTRAVIGISPSTGEVLGAAPLPESPSYGSMAFAGTWLSAVEVDLRGTLVSFDAGASYHPLGVAVTPPGVLAEGDHLVIATTQGAFSLSAAGRLERADGSSPEAAFASLLGEAAPASSDDEGGESDEADAPTTPFTARPLGGPALAVLALRGLPDGPGTGVVAAEGAVARIELADGRVADIDEHALPPGASCQAVPLGAGVGFVCGENRGRTSVHALGPRLRLTPVLEFEQPRQISASGNGALVVRGSCEPGAPDDGGTYCVRAVSGSVSEVHVRGDVGVERVVALADGRVAIVAPPRSGLAGALSLIGPGDSVVTRPLSLAAVPAETRELVSRALWLDGMIEIGKGTLAGFAVSSSALVGVRVGLDGKVLAGTPRSGAEHASLSVPFGLTMGDQGDAYETTDAGMTWSDVVLPSPDLAGVMNTGERGCTAVGCGLGSFVRIGWGDDKAFAQAKEPPLAKLGAASIVKWGFDCAPTGVAVRPKEARTVVRAGARRAVAVSRPPAGPNGSAPLDSSAWRTFMGIAGPDRGDDLGFDFGTEDQQVQLRGYVWGARGAPWDRTGSWLVRAVDRFGTKDVVWSTARSRPPWADANAAAEAFGGDPSNRVISEWSAVMDPGGEGGLLFVRTGSLNQLAVVQRDRAIVAVENAADFLLDRPAGVVNALGKWYVGSIPGPRSFQLLAIEGGTLTAVASYPRFADDAPVRVVRSSRGDSVGIWVTARGRQGTASGGNGWFVYPVDPASGRVGEPLVVPPSALASAPRPCAPDEEGWLLEQEVSASVARLDLTSASESPSTEHVEARLVVGPGGVCVDALAAQVDGDPPKDLRPTHTTAARRSAVSMVLTDRATDRRWQFQCAP